MLSVFGTALTTEGMATATDKRGSAPSSLIGTGRNILGSHHRCLSPMAQLKISCGSTTTMNSEATNDELPSPIDDRPVDDINEQAHGLARDFIIYKVEGKSSALKSEAAKTLRRVGDEAVDRNQIAFNAIARRLQYSNDPASEAENAGLSLNQRKFVMIASQISRDGQENWGRIVSLFVLGSVLALNNMEEDGGRDVENIINYVGTYIGTQKRAWIERSGGWAGFIKFFDDGASEEKKVWKGLLYAGLGLGAIASLVTRQ